MSDNFRPQAKPRPLYELDADHLRGLKLTTDNNQPLMALQYAHKLIEALVHRVDELEGLVRDLRSDQKTEVKQATRRGRAEEASSEG